MRIKERERGREANYIYAFLEATQRKRRMWVRLVASVCGDGEARGIGTQSITPEIEAAN